MLVDKGAVAGCGVLKRAHKEVYIKHSSKHFNFPNSNYPNVELSIGHPDERVISRQHLAVENRIVVSHSIARYRAAHLHLLVGLQHNVSGLENSKSQCYVYHFSIGITTNIN